MHAMYTTHTMHAHLAGDRDEVCQDAATHGHLGLHEDQCIIHLSFNIVKQRQGAVEKWIKKYVLYGLFTIITKIDLCDRLVR